MESGTLNVLLLMATLVLWLSLPLFPAILIYRLFPDTPVTLRGPFQSLTISAGGAFAAYFITLLVSLYAVRPIISFIRTPPDSVWTLAGTLAVNDENGKPHSVPQQGIVVSVEPSPVRVSGDTIEAEIRRNKSAWPRIRVEVPNYGARTFSLDSSVVNFEVNEDDRRVNLLEPLVVRRAAPISGGEEGDIRKIERATR